MVNVFLKIRNKIRVHAILTFLFNIVLKVLASATRKKSIKKNKAGTSLVAQWLRICLPMQGT